MLRAPEIPDNFYTGSNAEGKRNRKKLIDIKPPTAPYYLVTQDHFVPIGEEEIFLKHIYTVSTKVPRYGPVIMAPGICCNGNLFRVDDKGNTYIIDHNRSFANMLASEGFDVYLYHPGYSERVINRYVSRQCKDSKYYKKRFRVDSRYGYGNMVNEEVPRIIDFVCKHCSTDTISWIGYSLGGMIAYSYLSKQADNPIKNLVTIGSPMAFNHIFFRYVRYVNFTSSLLGIEEDAFLGNLTQNMVPMSRAIRALPSTAIRYNPVSPYLFNPSNISNHTVRTLLGRIVEPMPKELQRFFVCFIQKGGYSAQEKITNYLYQLRSLKDSNKNFLFFYGTNDLIASPESVFLAREVIAPNDPYNLIGASSTGHIDLIVGNNALHQVWKPTLEWLKTKVTEERNIQQDRNKGQKERSKG